jgi:hypothetical protein
MSADLLDSLRRNDASVSYISYFIGTDGSDLGLALVGNSHVATISLQYPYHELGEPVEDNIDSVDLLFRYVQGGPAMRSLCVMQCSRSYILRSIHAFSMNPNINHLQLLCEADEVPHDEFATLIQSTNSLSSLEIPLNLATDEGVARALGANRSIEELTITSLGGPASANGDGRFLYQLVDHPCLRSLCVFNCALRIEVYTALAHFMSHSRSLKHLWLRRIRLDEHAADQILQGISSRMQMLDKLELSEFRVSQYLASWIDLIENDETTVPLIRELKLQVPQLSHYLMSWVNAMVVRSNCLQFVLQWSDYEVSHITGRDYFLFLWNTIAGNDWKNCLWRIQLSNLPAVGCNAVSDCLPNMVHLRELHIDHEMASDEDAGLATELCRAIRSNGSLRRLSTVQEFPTFGNPLLASIAGAAIERNLYFSERLHDDLSDQRNDNESLARAILPRLFIAASHSSRMEPNFIFTGLLSAGNGIGIAAASADPL